MTRRDDNHERPKPSAYEKALGLLARREQSRRELGRKLGQKGYERDEADAALDRLGEQRYQDDERFAGMLVRNRASQGYGPVRIRMELRTHGVDDATVRQLLEEVDTDWHASAAAQLRRRYGGKPASDHAERAKRAQFLLRRGFSAATVRSVTHAEVDDADDD
ncbi:regulatory protein RecX [Dyella sp.]|jgi:regulatory protein|uniref:regulatory protein RecX n=1 Tax=Dyella sp. TaxID=1869338 RepID=UPI002D76F736|nr:regulatory protein RecX [Dyella sp.]HET6430871.1 regulatory protein RecX [Dyella sp.]